MTKQPSQSHHIKSCIVSSAWPPVIGFALYTAERGLPRWYSVQSLPANAGDTRDSNVNSGLGKSPGVGNGNPLQCSCRKIFMDRGAWQAAVHGITKSLWDCRHNRAMEPALILHQTFSEKPCLVSVTELAMVIKVTSCHTHCSDFRLLLCVHLCCLPPRL